MYVVSRTKQKKLIGQLFYDVYPNSKQTPHGNYSKLFSKIDITQESLFSRPLSKLKFF